jgi:hypothetical protein
MNILQLKAKEVYLDYDDISIIVQRPDIIGKKQSNVDPADRNQYEKANAIIEKAQEAGKYFDVAGRDNVVRSLIILKSGLVVGVNSNPDTVIKKIKSELRVKQTEKKTTRQAR